jgi:probable F420-dependent oxidoreductase
LHFAYGLAQSAPISPQLLHGSAVAAAARGAEAAGFEAGYVTDHPAPSERWREAGGHDGLDPFVTLAVMSQATSKLRLLTNLIVVPYRNPFLLARATSTLDVLSGGRLILGLGVGWQKSEFAALGVDFASRNDRFDEYLEVLRRAWSGGPVEFEGRFVSARGVTTNPPPSQQPGPPIWLGGNSRLTLRRAASYADGWMPMPNPRGSGGVPLETLSDLTEMLDYLHKHAETVGRTKPLDVMCILPPGPAKAADKACLDMVKRLADVGVTWLGVNAVGDSVEDVLGFLDRFGNQVIRRLEPMGAS